MFEGLRTPIAPNHKLEKIVQEKCWIYQFYLLLTVLHFKFKLCDCITYYLSAFFCKPKNNRVFYRCGFRRTKRNCCYDFETTKELEDRFLSTKNLQLSDTEDMKMINISTRKL